MKRAATTLALVLIASRNGLVAEDWDLVVVPYGLLAGENWVIDGLATRSIASEVRGPRCLVKNAAFAHDNGGRPSHWEVEEAGVNVDINTDWGFMQSLAFISQGLADGKYYEKAYRPEGDAEAATITSEPFAVNPGVTYRVAADNVWLGAPVWQDGADGISLDVIFCRGDMALSTSSLEHVENRPAREYRGGKLIGRADFEVVTPRTADRARVRFAVRGLRGGQILLGAVEAYKSVPRSDQEYDKYYAWWGKRIPSAELKYSHEDPTALAKDCDPQCRILLDGKNDTAIRFKTGWDMSIKPGAKSVTFDLGKARVLSGVVVSVPARPGTTWQIREDARWNDPVAVGLLASTDGQQFVDLRTMAVGTPLVREGIIDLHLDLLSPAGPDTEPLDYDGVTARHVRLILGRKGEPRTIHPVSPSISEVRFFARNRGVPLPPSDTLINSLKNTHVGTSWRSRVAKAPPETKPRLAYLATSVLRPQLNEPWRYLPEQEYARFFGVDKIATPELVTDLASEARLRSERGTFELQIVPANHKFIRSYKVLKDGKEVKARVVFCQEDAQRLVVPTAQWDREKGVGCEATFEIAETDGWLMNILRSGLKDPGPKKITINDRLIYQSGQIYRGDHEGYMNVSQYLKKGANRVVFEGKAAPKLLLYRTKRIGTVIGVLRFVYLGAPEFTAFIDVGDETDRVTGNLLELGVQPSSIQLTDLYPGPSGAHGFVSAKDGELVFEDGTPMTFWGVHVFGGWQFISQREQIEPCLEAMKMCGFRLWRFMSWDRLGVIDDYMDLKIDEQYLDNFFYFVKKAREAGIYIKFSITSASSQHGREWIEAYVKKRYGKDAKFDDQRWFHPPAGHRTRAHQHGYQIFSEDYRRWCRFIAKKIFTTKNPYTGVTLAEEPILVNCEVGNENDILWHREMMWDYYPEPLRTELRELWCKFLRQKYANLPALKAVWQDELLDGENPWKSNVSFPIIYWGSRGYRDHARRIASPKRRDGLEFVYWITKDWLTFMRKLLKEECGVRAPLGWCGPATAGAMVVSRMADAETMELLNTDNYFAPGAARSLWRFWERTGRLLINNRPACPREWAHGWWNQRMAPTNTLMEAIVGRLAGGDLWAYHGSHIAHSMIWPTFSNWGYRANGAMDFNRANLAVGGWVLTRSKLKPVPLNQQIIIGTPFEEALYPGQVAVKDRRIAKESFPWFMDQLITHRWYFKDKYDGPKDAVVFHEGRSPYGDYTSAKHVILSCHGDSGSHGEEHPNREDFFKLNGVEPFEGDYALTDRYLACRFDILETTERQKQVLYDALKRWGFPLNFTKDEILKVWRSPDGTVALDTRKGCFTADRDDMQIFSGELYGAARLSRLQIFSETPYVSVALLPFDTGQFGTARKLMLVATLDGVVRIDLPFKRPPQVWQVNWLGMRMGKVEPLDFSANALVLKTEWDPDLFFYEIAGDERQPLDAARRNE